MPLVPAKTSRTLSGRAVIWGLLFSATAAALPPSEFTLLGPRGRRHHRTQVSRCAAGFTAIAWRARTSESTLLSPLDLINVRMAADLIVENAATIRAEQGEKFDAEKADLFVREEVTSLADDSRMALFFDRPDQVSVASLDRLTGMIDAQKDITESLGLASDRSSTSDFSLWPVSPELLPENARLIGAVNKLLAPESGLPASEKIFLTECGKVWGSNPGAVDLVQLRNYVARANAFLRSRNTSRR